MDTVQRPGTTPRNSKPFLLKTKGQHRLNQVKKRETKLTRTKERTQEYTRRQAHAETNNDINANRQRKARHTDTNAEGKRKTNMQEETSADTARETYREQD